MPPAIIPLKRKPRGAPCISENSADVFFASSRNASSEELAPIYEMLSAILKILSPMKYVKYPAAPIIVSERINRMRPSFFLDRNFLSI
jgi:hypothetical protein